MCVHLARVAGSSGRGVGSQTEEIPWPPLVFWALDGVPHLAWPLSLLKLLVCLRLLCPLAAWMFPQRPRGRLSC